MPGTDPEDVGDIPVAATYDLRRRVLRGGRMTADVAFPADDEPGSFHLGLVDDDGRVVAVASGHREATALRPGRRSWRLRAMAVEPSHQRRGLGTALLAAVVQRAQALGAEVLWAAGRDSALGFYQAEGWQVEGDGYLLADLPHHSVVLDLGPAPSERDVLR